MDRLIKKILKIKLIKIIFCVWENFAYTIFPKLRNIVESKLYNPYDLGNSYVEYSIRQYNLIKKQIEDNNLQKWWFFLELWPWAFLWHHILLLKNNLFKKTFVLDSSNHFFIKWFENRYEKISKSYNRYVNKDKFLDKYIKVLDYNNIDKQKYTFDFIYSAVVLEHVKNIKKTIKLLSKISNKWCIHYHTIDMEDHIIDRNSLFFHFIPKWLRNFLFWNSWAYTNKLLYSDYKKEFLKNWFKILKEEKRIIKNKKFISFFNEEAEIAWTDVLLIKE